MKIAIVCVEDGLASVGVRKMASLIRSLNKDTMLYYVPYKNSRSLYEAWRGTHGDSDDVSEDIVREIAEALGDADIVGFSSMTSYSDLTKEIIAQIRKVNPKTYIIWGGIHPIIVPEDAIMHADAICTGEGEYAFRDFFEAYTAGEDYTQTGNFWFRKGEEIIKNPFLPLMSGEQMGEMPLPWYAEGEKIYEMNKGFVDLTRDHRLAFNGLSYNTVWSIGCPFKCTYCGNTRFIDNDPNYRKIRHSPVQYILDEFKAVLAAEPHISTMVFHDDSFMALPTPVLAEFAREYKKQIDIPFCVHGVIPNYVKEPKLQILLSAGLNRVRMGVQNGSERILQFYDRPTPPAKIRAAAEVLSRYHKYMIPPAYDIIVDNPVETTEDVKDNLALMQDLARPFTLNVFSLRAIPNTELERQMEERNITLCSISQGYAHTVPTLANCIVYLLGIARLPGWLFDRLSRWVKPVTEQQGHYPNLALVCRTLYLFRRAFDHLRFLDFSVLPGKVGFVLWKLGLLARRKRTLAYSPPPEIEAILEGAGKPKPGYRPLL